VIIPNSEIKSIAMYDDKIYPSTISSGFWIEDISSQANVSRQIKDLPVLILGTKNRCPSKVWYGFFREIQSINGLR